MTITTYTDREIALRQQLAAMTATATEYQQAADKMAMAHKVERDTLRQQLAAATQLAQLNGEIGAELKADKLALEAAIAASRKQEAVAWIKNGFRFRFSRPNTEPPLGWDALYAAPVVAPDVLKDAERYRWMREQSWRNNLCVVDSPKNSVKLGSFCPSHELLDAAIDAALAQQAEPFDKRVSDLVERLGGIDYLEAKQSQQAEQVQEVPPIAFIQWLRAQMPSGTIIESPEWWAIRIHREYVRAAAPKGGTL